MPEPLLSVVVPFYGVEAYIADCLESIRVQGLTDIEVLMVDDGSPDGSRAIAQQYADVDQRFRLITRENGGLGPARNTGTEHASGRYLTFIDSDDLVSRHGFELLVSTLERSGSSFALSNARRFNRTSGVRQSWTHAAIAARSRSGVHIQTMPSLIRDRMVWNKVYRKDFWDEQGYEFPPIRYEDYPVTMAAHLDALTVDVVGAHCYYWRERESGDSITQQAFKYGNLLDRVVSAEAVLDMVDDRGAPAVRLGLYNYLAEIDMIALLQAFSVAPDEDIDRLLELGHRLVDRLALSIGSRPRFDQIQYHALRANDVPLLRELATFRDEGGLVGGVTAHRSKRRPWRFDGDFPGRGRSTAPMSAYTFPVTSLQYRSLVTGLKWTDGSLHIRGTAEITHVATDPATTIKISAVSGIDRYPLPVEQFTTLDQHNELGHVGFEATLDLDALAAEQTLIWPLRFEVDVTAGGLRRHGLLRSLQPGSASYPAGRWLADGQWVQPGRARGGVLALQSDLDPTTLLDVTADGDHLVLTGRIPGRSRHADLRISRPIRDREWSCDLEVAGDHTTWTARIPAAAVVDGDASDDPFTLRARRRLTLITDMGDFPLQWTTYRHDVAVPVEDSVVTLTRGEYGNAVLDHGPARPSARVLRYVEHAAATTVEASGVHWPSNPVEMITWRRFVPGTDDYVDVPVDLDLRADGSWTARTPLAELLPPADLQPTTIGAPRADWALFVRIEGADHAISCEPAAAAGLPEEVMYRDHHVRLATMADTLRTRVM